MSRVVAFRKRLPCVGLFLAAAAGVIAGRYLPAPGAAFAIAAAALLAASFFRPLRWLLPLGVALSFAAAQAWQYRESAATRLAAQLTPIPQSCEATFTVLDAPRISRSGARCSFSARLTGLEISGSARAIDIRVLVLWNGPPPAYGSVYRTRAAIANCPLQRNPGAFDYTAWLANAGIRSQLTVFRPKEAELIRIGGNPLVRIAHASRAWVERTITLGIEDTPEAILIKGMTIGDISAAPGSMKDDFRETGTFHLFSVSGLHVGIVAVMIWAVLGMFGVSLRRSVIIIIPSLFFYALLTGLSAASVRAAIMLSVLAAGLVLDRPAVALNSIGAAGLALLAWDSSQLFNSGFQLSFGAVAMICLIAVPLHRRLGRAIEPDPFLPRRLIPPLRRAGYALANVTTLLIAVSFAAWLATLPLILYYFHLLSFSSIPANLLAVPLSSLVLALAAVSLVAGAVHPSIAEVFNQANYLLAKVVLFLVHSFAAIPGSSLYVGPPLPAGAQAQMTVLDAGSGSAAVLFSGGQTWLIDGGSRYFADSITVPFLRMSGVNRLDGFVITHGDSQHIGGGGRILADFHPRRVLDSGLPGRRSTRDEIIAAVPTLAAVAGARFPVGASTRLTILYPPPGLIERRADDKAVVLRWETGGFSALLMSDSGLTAEQWLLMNARDQLPCDLVIMGRHDSGFSGDLGFLRAAAPRAVLATAAAFPSGEEIRPEWAAALARMSIPLLRQDETGAVTVTVRPGSFTLTPFLSTGGPPLTFPHATDPLR